MPSDRPEAPVTSRSPVCRGLAVAVLLVATGTLVGWATGTESLVRLRPGWPVTVPTTALAAALLAGVLLARCRPADRRERVAPLLAALVATLGALALLHHLGVLPTPHPSSWLSGGLVPHVGAWQPDVDFPARPPVLTAIQLVGLGVFVAFEPSRQRPGRLRLWAVATVALSIQAAALVGYFGGDPEVLQPGTRLSLPAALMFAALWAVALWQAAPRLTADLPGWFGPATRTLLRRIGLPLGLLAPLIVTLQLLAERTAWMDPTTTLAGAAVVLAVGVVAFVVTTGRALDAAQAERRRSEALLRGVVDALEEGLIVRDERGELILTNPAVSVVSGLDYAGSPDAGRVNVAVAYHHADGTPDDLPSIRATRDGVDILRELGTITDGDGRVRWLRTNALVPRSLADGDRRVSVTTVADVTEEQRATHALAEAEQRFRLMFEQAPIGLASVTPEGRFEAVNDAFCELVGRSPDELLGGTFRTITHPDDLDADDELLADLAAGRIGSYQLDKRYLRPDGTEVWVALHAGVLRADDGSPQRYLSQVVDLSDRKRLEALLSTAASHDALTSLPNRRVLDDRLEHVRRRASRHPQRRSALLFIDLDGFKAINDEHGHDVGDALLAALADRLRCAVRAGETLARFGGDEFVVLVEEVRTDGDLQALHDRLDQVLHEPVTVAGVTLHPAASIGVHRYAPATATPQEALRAADARMYAAKRARRDDESGSDGARDAGPTPVMDVGA